MILLFQNMIFLWNMKEDMEVIGHQNSLVNNICVPQNKLKQVWAWRSVTNARLLILGELYLLLTLRLLHFLNSVIFFPFPLDLHLQETICELLELCMNSVRSSTKDKHKSNHAFACLYWARHVNIHRAGWEKSVSSLRNHFSSAVFWGCLVWISLLRSCQSMSVRLRSGLGHIRRGILLLIYSWAWDHWPVESLISEFQLNLHPAAKWPDKLGK